MSVPIDNFSHGDENNPIVLSDEDDPVTDVGEPSVCLNPRQNVITGLSKQTCDGYVQNLKNVAMSLQTMNEEEISKRANVAEMDPDSCSEAQFWKGVLRLENGKMIKIFKYIMGVPSSI